MITCCFIFVCCSKQHLLYTNNSLEDLLFTPAELIKVKPLCQTQPRFSYYHAGDKTPTVTQLQCVIDQKQLATWLSGHQFIQTGEYVYQQNQNKIELTDIHNGMINTLVFTSRQ